MVTHVFFYFSHSCRRAMRMPKERHGWLMEHFTFQLSSIDVLCKLQTKPYIYDPCALSKYVVL